MENVDYKQLYIKLFNKITDTIQRLELLRGINVSEIESCLSILKSVQQESEEKYISVKG